MNITSTWPPVAVAPWAEVVPGAGPMTMADYLAYPDGDGYRYELVDGVLVRMAGTRPEAGDVTRALLFPLAAYVQAHGLGVVTLPDEVYDFERTGQPNTGLLPLFSTDVLGSPVGLSPPPKFLRLCVRA